MLYRICGLIFVILVIFPARGYTDSWSMPAPEWYISADSGYCLEIIPDDYEYKIYRPEQMAFNPDDSIKVDSSYTTGNLYKKDDSGVYQLVRTTYLRNLPVRALVSDNADYVVTFDSWYSVGYGKNVIVIYDKDGQLIKNFALEDILDREMIKTIPCTSSSRWWGGNHYIDEQTRELVLKIVSNGRLSVFWNEWALFEDEMRINLENGEINAYHSNFKDVNKTYADTCYDSRWCPTIRFLYHKIKHPDTSLVLQLARVEPSENAFEMITRIYDMFKKETTVDLAAAYRLFGREVYLVEGRSDRIYFLLEGGDELKSDSIRNLLPFIIKLPNGKETYPLVSYENSLSEGLFYATDHFFDFLYNIEDDTTNIDYDYTWFVPSGRARATIFFEDSSVSVISDLLVTEFSPGTRLYIDLSLNKQGSE